MTQNFVGTTEKHGKHLKNSTTIAQEIRARIDKWDHFKLKMLHIKGNNYQNEKTATE
jgi:hypothetical protein